MNYIAQCTTLFLSRTANGQSPTVKVTTAFHFLKAEAFRKEIRKPLGVTRVQIDYVNGGAEVNAPNVCANVGRFLRAVVAVRTLEPG